MAPKIRVCCFGCDQKAFGEAHKTIRSSNKSADFPWESYSLKELMLATDNFSDKNMIGEGGFGSVYLGQTVKGTQIAVKRLKAMTPKAEMEFAVEVEMLGRVSHKNLLSLKGFYASGVERLIIYDYMPNQSIVRHLHGHDSEPLSWDQRMSIAVGSAEGLAYLHHEMKPHIIHRDVKASNVLLDAGFNPRVADFGFAKLVPDGVSQMTTRVKGTVGYLAPEYAMWGKVSRRCDVYSFGILLLEIVSGRRPVERTSPSPEGKKIDIVTWVRPLLEDGDLDAVADPRMEGRFDRDQMATAVALAMNCIDEDGGRRPSMREVVDVLRCGPARRPPRVIGGAAVPVTTTILLNSAGGTGDSPSSLNDEDSFEAKSSP